jgi:predicted hydrocarbon binding protein
VDRIPKSGFYYPNRIARIYLQAMEEVMGKNGLNAILNMANLQNLVDNYPPENLDRAFDFADYSALAGAGDLAFKVLPLPAKLKIGIPAMAKVFSTMSDQKSTVEETPTEFIYTMKPCPVCYGRKSDKPMCHAGAGLLQEGLKWLSGGQEFKVYETKCLGCGDDACVLVVQKEPIG